MSDHLSNGIQELFSSGTHVDVSDHGSISVSPAAYMKFLKLLDQPPKPNPKLRELLAEREVNE